MSATQKTIEIKVPSNYQLPSIYDSLSPEMIALVLDSGVEIAKVVGKDREKQLTELMAGEGELGQVIKRQLDTLVKELTTNLSQRNESTLTKLSQDLNTIFTRLSDEVDTLVKRNTNQSDDNARRVLNKIEDSLTNFTNQGDDITGLMSSQSEKLKSHLDTTMTALKELISKAETPLNSTRKGALNEQKSKDIIISTFGTPGTGFSMLPKEYRQCDHVFDWRSIRIMWEDKDYSRTVSQDEVAKAFRDFNEHQDCDVLVIVSAHTYIKGHETSTFDMEIHDNRLVLFISNFRSNVDVLDYVRSFIQPIIFSVANHLKENQTENSKDYYAGKIDALKAFLPILNRQMAERKRVLDVLLKDMRRQIQLIKHTDMGLDATIKAITSSIWEKPTSSSIEKSNSTEKTTTSAVGKTINSQLETSEQDDSQSEVSEDEDESSPASSTSVNRKVPVPIVPEAPKRGQKKCSKCGELGHTKATCGRGKKKR